MEVLDIHFMHVGVASLTKNEYVQLAVDKAPNFPYAFPLPSEQQAEGVACELLQFFLAFGAPKVIRCHGGK